MILIIDTATEFLSLALITEEGIIASIALREGNRHAQRITIEIDQLLKSAGNSPKDLHAMAINSGPGSFTGLRVGASTAKGMCFALNIPLIAINGLEAYGLYFYHKFINLYSDVFILIDARRNNYFYSQIKNGEIVVTSTFENKEAIDQKINKADTPLVVIGQDNEFRTEAAMLCQAALDKWKNKQWENLTFFEPNYYLNTYETK